MQVSVRLGQNLVPKEQSDIPLVIGTYIEAFVHCDLRLCRDPGVLRRRDPSNAHSTVGASFSDGLVPMVCA